MSALIPLLAHPGSPNNGWIGPMTVSAWVLLVVFVLVASRRLELEEPGDLLLPLAVVVLVASLLGGLGDVIDDQGPWSVPAGLVVLIGLLVAAFSQLRLSWRSRPTYAVLGLAVIASVVFYNPLDGLWFPDDQVAPLPALQDGQVSAEVVEAPDEAGTFTVEVAVSGATIGDGPSQDPPTDPETGVYARFVMGGVYFDPVQPTECADDQCSEATYELTLPPGVGTDDEVVVEMWAASELPFQPSLTTRFPVPGAG